MCLPTHGTENANVETCSFSTAKVGSVDATAACGRFPSRGRPDGVGSLAVGVLVCSYCVHASASSAFLIPQLCLCPQCQKTLDDSFI